MKILLTLFISILLHSQLLDYKVKPVLKDDTSVMGINILDSKELVFKNLKTNELSALAYSHNRLYALSDFGYLHHFYIDLQNDKINSLKFLKSIRLKNKKGKVLKKKKSDSEGMVLVDNQLYISFERKPRVEVYTLNGQKVKNKKIQKKLRDIDNYKGKNKALESIAYNKTYGLLVAPELELIGENENYHTIYAKYKTYKFKSSGSLCALEFISDDEILALERDFYRFTRKMIITLTKIHLDECKGNICKSEQMAKLSTAEGWSLDNFEGLTKVGKNRYLMVSDDNDSFLQKTLLVLFELR